MALGQRLSERASDILAGGTSHFPAGANRWCLPTRNLADDPQHAEKREHLDQLLHTMLDPVATDRRAKADQAALVARHGGREAALKLGPQGATPPPTVPTAVPGLR